MKLLVRRDTSICPICKKNNALEYYIGDEKVNEGDRADSIKCKYCNIEFGIVMTDQNRTQRPLTNGKGLREFLKQFTG